MGSLARLTVFAVSLAVFSGCSAIPYELHPSQWWKMNRQPPLDEGRFSIPDPVDSRVTTTGAITPMSLASSPAHPE